MIGRPRPEAAEVHQRAWPSRIMPPRSFSAHSRY